MAKIAVILAGCGYLDGAEINETVITLVELDKLDIDYRCFAPDRNQHHVINHLTKQEDENAKRNILVEAARIARGKVEDLDKLNAEDFDAIILPGGFGVAKNFCTIAFDGGDATINKQYQEILIKFYKLKKPIGAICISPAALSLALKNLADIKVTIGEDKDKLISRLGATHIEKATNEIVIDQQNNIISTSAFTRHDARLKDVSSGITALVKEVVARVG